MWGLIFTAGAVIVLALFPAVRCAVFHPLHVLYYGTLDTFDYIRRKQYNLCHTGDLDIYCGYFGSGKRCRWCIKSRACMNTTTANPSGARAGRNSSRSVC